MCGIVGSIGKEIPSKLFHKVLDLLAHRGPNDSGVYKDSRNRLYLGHRRLSIIDLSEAGRQPFHSEDGRFVLIHNGEIYNYLELRRELEGMYQFKTKTDTEVLLAAYMTWGSACLDKFNGMFAFAIWDTVEEVLFCARDRIGIKPFFYTNKAGTFSFASEIKALLPLQKERVPNDHVIFDYLYYGFYDHTDETFFKGINKLPAGHYAIWKKGKLSMVKYWDLKMREHDLENISESEACERFKDLMKDSIQLRLRSDVPVGINLSSGLDSNTLFHLVEHTTKKKIDMFSMCLPSDEYNECSLIDNYLIDEQKSRWYQALVTPQDVFSLADTVNRQQDQPYGGVPTMSYEKLNRVIKERETIVVIEGQGADELLAGYAYFRLDYDRDRGRESNTSLEVGQDKTSPIDRGILNSDFVAQRNRSLSFNAPFSSHLLNAQYRDLMYTKLPRELRFIDHASMAHGREYRVPFLDHRVIEFCFFLPSRFKINHKTQKVLLRNVAEDLLPTSILARQKKAFGAVQTEWLRKHHRDEVMSFLTSVSFVERPYWNHKALQRKVNRFYSGVGDNSFFLWQCINLELWFRAFIDTH